MAKGSAIRLPTGQVLETMEGGDPKGLPIFTFHGTPGSRLLYPPHDEDARKRGIRLIGFNRPGYGESTRVPGRRIVDAVSDLSSIADSLGIEKFGVWGHSGGGKYALACAAALPDRTVGAASLSTLAPLDAEGLDWFAGMGEFNVEDVKLMLRDQKAWEEKSVQDTELMKKGTREDVRKMLDSLLSEVDKGALTEELDEFLHASTGEGLSSGPYGAIDDSLADASPWGFELASIRIPTQVWHGGQDRFCPFAHGQWLASRVPNAEAHLEENGGHLTMFIRAIPEVHRWLAASF
jgi:pimeloyl-ACP methyl ester carboxylesterase